jgi:predicted phage tail protein
MMRQLIKIKLGLGLGRRFGRVHEFAVGDAKEAIRALSSQVPGFKEYMGSHVGQNSHFAIFVDGKNINEHRLDADKPMKEIRIMPIPQGRKSGGLFQTVLGAALIVVGVVFQQYYLVGAGISLAAGGVAQLLSPQATGFQNESESAENRASYAFGSAVNTVAAGYPVCLPYGYRTVGGSVFSSGSYAEDIS